MGECTVERGDYGLTIIRDSHSRGLAADKQTGGDNDRLKCVSRQATNHKCFSVATQLIICCESSTKIILCVVQMHIQSVRAIAANVQMKMKKRKEKEKNQIKIASHTHDTKHKTAPHMCKTYVPRRKYRKREGGIFDYSNMNERKINCTSPPHTKLIQLESLKSCKGIFGLFLETHTRQMYGALTKTTNRKTNDKLFAYG